MKIQKLIDVLWNQDIGVQPLLSEAQCELNAIMATFDDISELQKRVAPLAVGVLAFGKTHISQRTKGKRGNEPVPD